MLTFLTAFLGLVVGLEPVELEVSPEVSVVELRLDDREVATLRGAPFKTLVDFGPVLQPHRLEAVGFDADGVEVTRQTRWINLPQPRSRAEIHLAEDGRSARLAWHSADGTVPDTWQVKLDGEPLEVEDPRNFTLPDYDPETPHVLQAELRFGRGVARVEQIVGGRIGEEVDSQLTALTLQVSKGRVPTAEDLVDRIWFGEEPLEVVSVEKNGGSDIVMVQDSTPAMWGSLNRIRESSLAPGRRGFMAQRLTSGLLEGDRLWVILPLAERTAGAAMDQFHISYDFSRLPTEPRAPVLRGSAPQAPRIHGVLATLPYPTQTPLVLEAPRRTAEAVAVAAQVASAKRRPRAVVLVRDPRAKDHSDIDPSAVRPYLSALQVPLLVWAPNGDEQNTDGWGARRDISSLPELKRAVVELRETLDRQVVVWVRGRHRPQDIEVRHERLAIAGAYDPDADPPRVELPAPEPVVQPADVPGADPVASPGEPTADDARIEPAAEMPLDAVADTVEIRLVEIPVVVTDGEGERVYDLTREDFELRVDGEPVELGLFEPPPVLAGSPPADNPSTDAPAEALPAGTEAPRLVIFYDSRHLSLRARRSLAEALRDVIAAGDTPFRTMLITYDRVVHIPLPFTTDARALAETLVRIEEGDLVGFPEVDYRGDLANRMARVEDALVSALDPTEKSLAEAERDALLADLRARGRTREAETRAVVDALGRLSAGLGAVDGRKILLYVGDGLELSPLQELYDEAAETLQMSPLQMAALRSESQSVRVHDAFDELLDKAQTAGVTFYAVTPKVRGGSNVVQRGQLSRVRPGAQARLPSSRQEQVREAACLLSGETGGRCQVGGTRPRRLIRDTVGDLQAFYTLAFTPPAAEEPGRFRRVEVRVERPGLQVRHPLGYSDPEPRDRLHERLSAALYFGAEDDALGLVAEVDEIRKEKEFHRVRIDVEVPIERLGLKPVDESAGRLVAEARLAVSTRRHQDGTVTEVQEFPITFQVEADRIRNVTYAHRVDLLLAPGDYSIALGLWDDVSELGAFRSLFAVVE